jgi:hypothetical protein
MSHGYIVPLYVAILWLTYKWHKKPTLYSAAGIGYVIGLATISRPTEAVMLFIPLLWSTDSRDHSGEKWRLVKEHKSHLAIAALFGLFGILPQLLYWKVATGSFVFDVGSKWTFLNPFFRVLFGWEKGWFIYTPVTLFFVVGLFFVKRYPFKNSVIWFCILNIYIIISWFDWRYGGSYSTRALSQSYAVFALPFAAFISYIEGKRWKILVYIIGVYLIAVNLFQIWQYNSGILHFNDMNRKYYGRIYLNRNPLASDMSLLDTDEFVRDENKYRKQLIITRDSSIPIILQDGKHFIFLDTSLAISKPAWIKVQASVSVTGGIWKGRLFAETGKKKVSVRMDNAISAAGKINEYVFYIRLDEETDPVLHLRMWLEAGGEMDCIIKGFQIFALHKR